MYYKVVTDDLKSYMSMFNCHKLRNSDYVTQYKIGEIVYPKNNTKLFIFRDINSALSLLMDGTRVYSCEAVNPQPCYVVGYNPDMAGCIDFLAVDNFWNNRNYWCSKNPPSGTIECDGVKLLSLIS